MNDGVLQFGVIRLPRGMPQGKIKEGGSWGIDRLSNIQGAAHTDGGDSLCLGMPSDQSHGLMAYGSDRDKEESIDLVFQQFFGNGRSQILSDFPGRINASHKGVLEGGQFPDKALFFHLAQRIDGKNAIGVLAGVRLVISEMGDPEVGRIHIFRDHSERIIVFVMKSQLSSFIDSPRGRNSDSAFAERLF